MNGSRHTPLRLLALLLGGLVIAAVAVSLTSRPQEAAASTSGESAGFSPGGPILWESDADLARDLGAMAGTGAKWLRVDFDWPSVEPTPGVFNWAPTERVVRGAQARGLKIIALPAYTPAWARPPGTTDKHPPSQPSDFAAFVRVAALHFAPSGVKVWEMWNEPNTSAFWQPRPDPAAYADLLRGAARAVRDIDPTVTVLSAGLSPAVDAPDASQIAPTTYLQRLYAAQGGPSFDAVGIHPYSYPALPLDPATANWNTLYRLPLLYEVMVANGDGAKKIWATEFGAPTSGPGAVSEDQQVQMVTAAYAAFASWPWAGPMLWYSIRDQGTDPGDREDHFGLIRRDFTPKPAMAIFSAMIGTAPSPPPSPGADRLDWRRTHRSTCIGRPTGSATTTAPSNATAAGVPGPMAKGAAPASSRRPCLWGHPNAPAG